MVERRRYIKHLLGVIRILLQVANALMRGVSNPQAILVR
jgi:hypothetical protein